MELFDKKELYKLVKESKTFNIRNDYAYSPQVFFNKEYVDENKMYDIHCFFKRGDDFFVKVSITDTETKEVIEHSEWISNGKNFSEDLYIQEDMKYYQKNDAFSYVRYDHLVKDENGNWTKTYTIKDVLNNPDNFISVIVNNDSSYEILYNGSEFFNIRENKGIFLDISNRVLEYFSSNYTTENVEEFHAIMKRNIIPAIINSVETINNEWLKENHYKTFREKILKKGQIIDIINSHLNRAVYK